MEPRESSIDGQRRRGILNELSRLSSPEALVENETTEQDSTTNSFILIVQDDFVDNVGNIINNSVSSTKSSSAEELVIQGRGRRKRKSKPSLRDLSPRTLATFKSPMKFSKNEDLAYFLRSPTPKKRQRSPENGVESQTGGKQSEDNSLAAKFKRARKSLNVELESSLLNANGTTTSIQLGQMLPPASIESNTVLNSEDSTSEEIKQPEEESSSGSDNHKTAESSSSSSSQKMTASATNNNNQKTRIVNSNSKKKTGFSSATAPWRNSPRKNLRRSTNVAR